MQNHLPAKLLAEFIGTFAFVRLAMSPRRSTRRSTGASYGIAVVPSTVVIPRDRVRGIPLLQRGAAIDRWLSCLES